VAPSRDTSDAWGPLLTPDQYAELFPRLFTESAFRLELLDHYINPAETDAFELYLRGQADDLAWRQPWIDLVSDAIAAGKTMTRVRVVSEPWTDYTAFELTRVYQPAVDAGEDVRVAVRSDPAHVGHDFWLTEAPGVVARMEYTAEGEWTGVRLSDRPSTIAHYRTWRAAAVASSVPLNDYLAMRRSA
jgi:hypothetical protein